jgi:hypothetical protein
MQKYTLYIGGFLIVLIAGSTGFASLHASPQPHNMHAATTSSMVAGAFASQDSPITITPTPLPDGMMAYKNPQYHFTLAYPKELSVQEYAENGGGRTITFQNAANDKGFQIFITPYTGTQIDQKRFIMDEPSGVRNQPTSVVIDGTTATMFFGSNTVMGDTREVWFIHGGFLFEVTTYKPQDAWLGQIMQSWKFL